MALNYHPFGARANVDGADRLDPSGDGAFFSMRRQFNRGDADRHRRRGGRRQGAAGQTAGQQSKAEGFNHRGILAKVTRACSEAREINQAVLRNRRVRRFSTSTTRNMATPMTRVINQ